MDKKIKALRDWGCDTNAAMERMLDDEEFYLECLNDIPVDPNFALLIQALEAGDAKAAFGAAHTLKGVLANLGITPMYIKTVEIVEPLREKECDGLSEKVRELIDMRDRLDGILRGN